MDITDIIAIDLKRDIQVIQGAINSELDCMIQTARLWNLSLDSPKIDKFGSFQNCETLLKVEAGGALAVVLGAEANFQKWAMSAAFSFEPGFFTPMCPSIFNHARYTSRANAKYAGLGSITEKLCLEYTHNPKADPVLKEKAAVLLEALGGHDLASHIRARYAENLSEMQTDSRYAVSETDEARPAA